MDTLYLDTNVILRFLILDKINPKLSEKARELFLKLTNNEVKLYTNILVISEAVYVLEKFYKLEKREIVEKISAIIEKDDLMLVQKDKVYSSLIIYADKNVDFEDAYLYLDALENNVTDIATFDLKHFSRFSGINIK